MTVKAGDRVERGQDIGYFAFGGPLCLMHLEELPD